MASLACCLALSKEPENEWLATAVVEEKAVTSWKSLALFSVWNGIFLSLRARWRLATVQLEMNVALGEARTGSCKLADVAAG